MNRTSTSTGVLQTSHAVIKGLNQKPYYSEEKLAYFWDITFEEHPVNFGNISMIYMGKTEEEANEYYETLINRLNTLGIKDSGKILVMCDSGEVLAISTQACILWVDVTDKFHTKSPTKLLSDLRRKNNI